MKYSWTTFPWPKCDQGNIIIANGSVHVKGVIIYLLIVQSLLMISWKDIVTQIFSFCLNVCQNEGVPFLDTLLPEHLCPIWSIHYWTGLVTYCNQSASVTTAKTVRKDVIQTNIVWFNVQKESSDLLPWSTVNGVVLHESRPSYQNIPHKKVKT